MSGTMISIRLLDNNLVELEFEDRFEYEMTRSELENRLGTGATKSITHGENNFSLNLRDFEYLLISENWLDDEYGITIEEEVMELLENSTEYHKELVEGGEEVWDAESILNHLTATYSTKRTPTDFQLENLEKMLMRPAAASFSVPGAGKTSEGLCYWLCNRSEDGKLLVVLPKVGFLAWEEEFREWIGWGHDKVIRLDISSADFDGKISANPDASVYLVTYARARNNEKNILDLMSEGEWSMILDESHNIKSLTGATSQSVRRIGNYARCCRLILTGTPAPQGEQDLHSQAEFLQNRRINSAECADWIRNIKVRTTKEQLKLKPTKTISHKEPLPKSHQAIYELLTNRLRRSIVDEENPDLAISEIRRHIMDIMRAASNPAILCKMPIFSNSLPKEMIA
ncbi:SNF2-related protein, partial [Candidatus Poseidoniaceae archaeon]|nr:SNF2-related protein [Candidatus Poseidoniaceae archaeon]